MLFYKRISRIPECYSEMVLAHNVVYFQFSSHPKGICEGEKVIEIQACLLMKGGLKYPSWHSLRTPSMEVYSGLRETGKD